LPLAGSACVRRPPPRCALCRRGPGGLGVAAPTGSRRVGRPPPLARRAGGHVFCTLCRSRIYRHPPGCCKTGDGRVGEPAVPRSPVRMPCRTFWSPASPSAHALRGSGRGGQCPAPCIRWSGSARSRPVAEVIESLVRRDGTSRCGRFANCVEYRGTGSSTWARGRRRSRGVDSSTPSESPRHRPGLDGREKKPPPYAATLGRAGLVRLTCLCSFRLGTAVSHCRASAATLGDDGY